MYWWVSISYSISKTVSYLKIELFDTELQVLGKFHTHNFEGNIVFLQVYSSVKEQLLTNHWEIKNVLFFWILEGVFEINIIRGVQIFK